ncbi:hypothetical protein AX14_013067 [Amanita brunnescens Koide BX004]|nr:hypothetical protein AX14_013067 [Amanita brunnescens Koide BX004]
MLPLRGYVFIGLNVIRIISIVSLILVLASNVETLVHDVVAVNHFIAAAKGSNFTSNDVGVQVQDSDYILGSTVPNQPAGAFWAVLNRLLIIGQTIVLLLSEFGWPSVFFQRFFPILGKDFGLGPLGLMQCLIGAAVLSHYVDTFTLVSAFLVFSVGCLHILLGFIFSSSARAKRSVTSWRDQVEPPLPSYTPGSATPRTLGSPPSLVWGEKKAGSSSAPGAGTSAPGKTGMGFGRQAEKAAGLKGFLISKPLESLPRYAPRTTPTGNHGTRQ